MSTADHRICRTSSRAPLTRSAAGLGGAAAAGKAFVLASLVLALAACFGPSPDKQLTAVKQHLGRDEAMEAVIAAKSLLTAKPDLPAGRFLLGRALFAAGDLEGAATELGRADAAGYDANELAPALAALWLAQQQPAKVLSRFEGQLLKDPQAAAQLLTHVAQAQRELGQAGKAQQSVQAALKQAPGFVPATILGARLAADAADPAAALRVAAELVAGPGAVAEAWLLQGDLLVQQGLLAKAVLSYRKALELRPRLPQAHIGLVMTLLRQSDAEGARTQIAAMRKAMPRLPLVDYLDGLAAYLRGDLPRAREMTDQLARNAKPTAQTLLLGGMVQARLGNPEQAEALLARAVSEAPQWIEARREYARLQLQLARPERALEALKPVLVENPADADLWAVAGQTYTRLGDFRQADDAFGRANALRPGDAGVRAAAAKSRIARGQVELGLRELEAVAQADVDGIGTDLALVAAQMQQGNRAAAMQALDVAARKRPELALPLYLRGRALEQFGDRTAARKAYEQALAKDGAFRQATAALAGLDVAEGRPADARQRYEALIKRDPKAAAAANLALAELGLRTGAKVSEINAGIDKSVQADPKDLGNWRAAIGLQRQLGDPAATLARAQAANAAIADESSLMLELASAQFAGGEPQQALTTLHRLVGLRPQLAEAQLRLAVGYGMAGKLESAREPLQKALALAPDNPAVLRGAIAMALGDKQPERARSLAREVQKRLPQAPLGWELEAEVENALGNARGAALAYKGALERGAAPETAVMLHRALLASDTAAAQQFEQQWLKRAPTDAFFVVHLAETAQRAGKTGEAEARYRQALKMQPDNGLIMNNLADLLLQRKDPEALPLALRAANLTPQLPAVLDTLAAAYAQARQTEKAVRTQQRAVELLPGDPTLRLNLARHLHASGDKTAAREQLQRAQRGGLSAAQREQAEQLQRQLGA